jgi:hypothetical protein
VLATGPATTETGARIATEMAEEECQRYLRMACEV